MKDESEGNFFAELCAALDRAEKLALAKNIDPGLQSGTFTCGGQQCTWRVKPVNLNIIGTDADRGRAPEPPALGSWLVH